MDVKVPFFVKHLSVYMATLEDCHSVWFDVLYVLKLLLYFVTPYIMLVLEEAKS